MTDTILQWFSGMPDWLAVVLLSALPITELRAALPIALYYFDMPIGLAVFFSILGNMIPIALIFLFFPPLLKWAAKYIPWLHTSIFNRMRILEGRYAEKYQRWGAFFLFLFVAIPLPGSGVWTGSLLAIIFGMRLRLSIPAILLGMFCSAGIVLLLSLGIVSFAL